MTSNFTSVLLPASAPLDENLRSYMEKHDPNNGLQDYNDLREMRRKEGELSDYEKKKKKRNCKQIFKIM